MGSRVPCTTHVGASSRHAPLARIQILTRYSRYTYVKTCTTNLQSSLGFNQSFRNKSSSINSVDYVCSPLDILNHAMAIDEVTDTPEAPADL